jgi:hypothetical protein
MSEIQAGDYIVIDDLGVRRACIAETMPRSSAFRPEEWDPERLYLRDGDGRYFPLDMPRWEGRK